MKPTNIPENETERLKVLKTYNLLDTLPDEDYDAITKLLLLYETHLLLLFLLLIKVDYGLNLDMV
jgi:hypothetical protein